MNDAIQKNVLGEPLELCGEDPITGYYRDGSCRRLIVLTMVRIQYVHQLQMNF